MSVTSIDPLLSLKEESVARELNTVDQALYDRYRYPRDLLRLGLNGTLAAEKHHFRFGPDIFCYGSTCSTEGGGRYDALRDVAMDHAMLHLPFDPSEIVENLQLERYTQDKGSVDNFAYKALRKLYYLLRPLTNLAMRRRIQRLYSQRAKTRPFPRWPVDTTVEDISERLLLLSMQAKGVEKVPFVWFWPRGVSSCLIMTHDVETRAGWDRCMDLVDTDDSFAMKASFQIVPEKRYVVSEDRLDSIRHRGFEIAIQDLNHDGRLFESKEQFLRRVKAINRYGQEYGAKGFRAAVLYREPEWYGALDFAFDMSIPNVAHLDPQRGGCCTVMPYFIGEILELPVTTTQDYTLLHILNQRNIELWKTQVELIMQKHGLVSFIIHPDYSMDSDALPLYKELLTYLRELRRQKKIWNALPSEVNAWWRARSKMHLVVEGESWRIEGDESGQAVLAYARNLDGKLVYELAEPC